MEEMAPALIGEGLVASGLGVSAGDGATVLPPAVEPAPSAATALPRGDVQGVTVGASSAQDSSVTALAPVVSSTDDAGPTAAADSLPSPLS